MRAASVHGGLIRPWRRRQHHSGPKSVFSQCIRRDTRCGCGAASLRVTAEPRESPQLRQWKRRPGSSLLKEEVDSAQRRQHYPLRFLYVFILYDSFFLSSSSVQLDPLWCLLLKRWHTNCRRGCCHSHILRENLDGWEKPFVGQLAFLFHFSLIATVGLVENVFNKQYHSQMSSLAQSSFPLFAFGHTPV